MASKAPPPSSPAGVPSGNAKYGIIAVLLLFIIAGIAYWKLTQTPPPPVTVNLPVDAGTVPPPRPTDDDIPPPPPVDAGVEAGPKKVVVVQLSNGCNVAKCGGSASPELENALRFRARQAHRCYDNALAQDSTLKGRVSISVRIGTDGSVCNSGIASNDMGTPLVANCVLGYFRGGGFPAAKGGCADVKVPISFVPK
ncbi:MAG: AgmX/PglI C-terminal domain-containing protein [Myxococcales bacterium]|nr:AgmX/PglI C-terminal domain-containing protein [Myxococcales bacterium]